MSYITTADIEKELNLTLTADGLSLVTMLINATQAAAETYCNRKWAIQGNITEYFDGGKQSYFIKNVPIATIVSVTVDGVAYSSSSYFNYGSYVKLAGITNYGYQNVVIVYTISSTVPDDLKQALIEWVSQKFLSAETGGKIAEQVSLGSSNIKYLVKDGIPQTVSNVLDSYRVYQGV